MIKARTTDLPMTLARIGTSLHDWMNYAKYERTAECGNDTIDAGGYYEDHL
jgi:hypothetical protein